ncbi:zinc-binding dehydrogenase [Microbacterium sp. CBA3102]|uniref:zinc-binding dehydrogenase n=1 Tax=Microbacterium sp. CBA3102 TaxID=2603598 RepID=UPI0011BB6158|nr:zinc-binding dehydrogenase [Microbacterium sp. CBA3102]QEA27720.1 zinc-binding dehydrogenase [Microbacterium sp. CBA3102]
MLISQVIGPRRSEIVSAPDPIPTPSQVVIDVLACGVCTSDRTPWREHGTPDAPVRLGHETVGRISAVGDPHGRWSVGEVVTGLGGDGFATKVTLDADSILRVPAGFAAEHVIGEPLADLEEALSRTSIRPGDRVAVVGLGFMGLGLVQLAAARLPGLLVAVDPNPAARARALALGAHEAHHPDELPAAFTSATGDREQRMDVVIEAAGATSALATSSSLVRPYGTVCIVGYHHTGDAPMDMELWYKGATIVNGFSPSRPRTLRAMADGLAMIADGRFSYRPLITHTFALEDVDQAYELMETRPSDFVKGVVVFSEQD